MQVSCRVISLEKCRSPAEAQKARARERRRGGKGRREGRKGGGQQAAQNPVAERACRACEQRVDAEHITRKC